MLLPVAQAMRAGKARILIGAGLSMESGLSSWLDLLAPVIREGLGIDLHMYDDLPEVSQFYEDRVPGGRARLVAAVAADVGRPVVPSLVHAALAQLPIAECWTTNFDGVLEQVLPHHVVVESDSDLAAATRQRNPILVKMHGSLPSTRPTDAQIARVVLTRDDFDNYQVNHPRLWSRLAGGYLSGSMLFLGLSLSDPNMRLLQRLARAAQQTGVDTSSVVVIKAPEDEQDRLRFEPRVSDLARSGVTVLTIASHGELEGVLTRLRSRLRPPRVVVSGSTNSLDDKASAIVLRAAGLLGSKLAERGVAIAHGGSDVGAVCAQRFAETSSVLSAYDPTLITAVRRRALHRADYIGYPPGPGEVGMPRSGSIRFVGETPEEMRAELARLGCVVAVLGGGRGTAKEVNHFAELGLPIVPWPATGGTAASEGARLDSLLSAVPAHLRAQMSSALQAVDLELGAVAIATLLEGIQRPFADMGPTSELDPLRL